MKYDLTEIGSIRVCSQFDKDLYSDYLEENGLQDSPELRIEYSKEECLYDVEFFDSETYHHIGYEQMSIYEIENEFGEEIANDVLKDCMDGREHEYEPLAYMNDTVNVNNPAELAKAAMKYLRSGEYFKNCRGFILSNGVMAYTDAEHNMCTRIPGVKGTSHFIDLGNVRVLDHSVDIAKRPTAQQRETLERVFSAYYGEEVYLDLCNDAIGRVSVKYGRCTPYAALSDIERYFNGQLKEKYIVRESMKISSKDIRKAVTESIKGFRPNAMYSSAPAAPKAEKVYSTSDRKPAAQGKPQQPVDYDKVELVHDPKLRSGADWAKYGGNFPVRRNGRVYYVSRSVAVSMYCYCMDRFGNWCVLANQRGPGAPNNVGLWNVPCGYLDYNEDALTAAVRETFEETGVKIPKEKVAFMGANSKPNGGSQNVSMRHACVLDGTIEDYPVSDANCEEGEVTDIRWIRLGEVKNYQWAFGMGHKVLDQARTSLIPFMRENGVEDLIKKLRNEIRGNVRANNLLDKILKHYETPATK